MSKPPAQQLENSAAQSITQAQRAIDAIEQDERVRWSFAARAVACEELDALQGARDPAVRARAERLLQQLEAADIRLASRWRARIRGGHYTRLGTLRALARHAAPPGGGAVGGLGSAERAGYDALDVLLSCLLDAGELPVERVVRDAEMVAYQPAPGRVILSLLAHVRQQDVFYDLGAGLGRVVILVALLCGVRATGVEIEPEFCAYAARVAAAIAANRAEFIAADARDASFQDGTLFFLYTPFRGELLRQVLARLRATAQRRPIRICTFGPCTYEVAGQPWLKLQTGVPDAQELAVFESA